MQVNAAGMDTAPAGGASLSGQENYRNGYREQALFAGNKAMAVIEHVENAGVHSGDSMAVYPSLDLTVRETNAIVDYTTRIGLGLGVKGLMNVQYVIFQREVFVLEVNPRASRTVPFMSKVTGVPMVELAVRISLGATLRELGWDGGLLPSPALVAVKAPAFSTAKLRGVDPSLGPGMQSTGEVIGISTDPRVALAKALLGAALIPPRPGVSGALALLSIADRDKALLPRLASANPGSWRYPLYRSLHHPELGAQAAERAGLTPSAVILIRRHQGTLPPGGTEQEGSEQWMLDEWQRALKRLDDEN